MCCSSFPHTFSLVFLLLCFTSILKHCSKISCLSVTGSQSIAVCVSAWAHLYIYIYTHKISLPAPLCTARARCPAIIRAVCPPQPCSPHGLCAPAPPAAPGRRQVCVLDLCGSALDLCAEVACNPSCCWLL